MDLRVSSAKQPLFTLQKFMMSLYLKRHHKIDNFLVEAFYNTWQVRQHLSKYITCGYKFSEKEVYYRFHPKLLVSKRSLVNE
jgi:hypothetical protein